MSKKNINNITNCLIDNTSFQTMRQFLYHLKELKISEKDYYDSFLKKENEGICKSCGIESIFTNIGNGYTPYCSLKCAYIDKSNPKNISEMVKKTRKTKLDRYGNEKYTNVKAIKQTKFFKFGDENYVNPEKAKQTNLEKYGEVSYTKTLEYKEKTKQTNLEKYGVEYSWQNEDVKNKIKQTNLERYGVEYTLQLPEIRKRIETTVNKKYGGFTLKSPFLKEKVKQTMLNKYGVDSPLKNKDIKKKQQQTNLEKYGYTFPTQNEDVKNKTKHTNLEKYGVENTFNLITTKNTFMEKYGVINPSQIPEVKEKIKQTCLKKYGNETFFGSEYAVNKIKQTCLEKYGVENIMQNKEMYRKILLKTKRAFKLKQYITKYDDIIFYQSNPELEFIILCETNNIYIENGPTIKYELNGKSHIYHSDFLINENNNKRIVEIKRKHKWWYRDLKTGMIKAKANAAIQFSKQNGYLPYKILFENKM